MSGNNVIRGLRASRGKVVFLFGALIVFASVAATFAQVRFEVPLYVTDGPNIDTIYFGILPGAVFGVSPADSINGHEEYELPPFPPGGVFEARYIWPRTGVSPEPPTGFGQGTPNDFRPYTSTTQRDTFRVKCQLGAGTTMVLSWPAGLSSRFTALTIRYFDGSGNVNTDMLTNTSVNITDAGDPAIANIYSGGLVLPPQPPAPPSLLSPSDGALNVLLQPVLTWSTVPTATSYRLQVARDSLFGQIVFDDSTLTGTSRQVGPLNANTLHYWRVRAKNVGGIGPYSVVFRFTTLAPPPAPNLVSPLDGELGVSLVPVLTWGAVATATTYRLQVAQDSLFGQIVFDDSTLTGSSRQIGVLNSSTRYFWHVRAKNAAGSGIYSVTFRFTTTETPPAPTLISPPDSAVRVPSAATFVWSAAPGATSYHLQVATGQTFTSLLVNDSTISGTTRTVSSLPYSAMLWWRVRARNSSGPSDFSAPRVFTVMQQPPSVPTQVAPANNQSNTPVELMFRWTNAVLASGYHLQIAHDTLMTNMFLSDTTITDSFKTVRVAPTTAYYWRVRAHNIENTYGAFSPVHRFNTANVPPAVPIPTFPANGDTGVARNPTLRWIGSPGAFSYRIQVSFDIIFTQIVADDSTVTALEFSPGVLPSRTSCFWRVRAKGTVGSSAYCQVQSFRTGSVIVSVEPGEAEETPSGFALRQNYPNPFNPSTSIPFELSAPAHLSLKVYDLLGREVKVLVDEGMPQGAYKVQWDGQSDNGQIVPSGLYFVRMTAVSGQKSVVAVQKMLLLK